MKTIRYCSDARITEAWCAVVAPPGPVQEEEAGYILAMAKRAHRDLSLTPMTRVFPRTGKQEFTPSYWSHEVQWNEGRSIARFGHRLLGLHRRFNPDARTARKYSTYEKEIVPSLTQWLDLLKTAQPEPAMPIANLQFGYVNRFPVDLGSGIDLEKMFHIRYGLKTVDNMGLGGVDLTFNLGKDDTRIKINFKSTPTYPSGQKISFIVKIGTTRDYSDMNIGMTKKILSEMDALHVIAKESFFAFITDELRDSMGPQFDG